MVAKSVIPDSTAILWAARITAIVVLVAAIAAVWVALRDHLTQLRGAADLSRKEHIPHIHGDAEILIVELVNRGVNRLIVTGAYWRIGWFKPETVAASVVREQMPLPIEARRDACFPIVLNDTQRTLIFSARKRMSRVALIVRTTTGDEVRCGLTRNVRQWISTSRA